MTDSTELDVPGKTCTQCRNWKALTNFYARKRAKDGRESYCKECAKARSLTTYMRVMQDPVKAAALKAQRAEYREANRNRIAMVKAEWQRSNAHKVNAASRRYYERNVDARRAYQATWRKENAERHRAMIKAWEQANPEKLREKRLRRIARELAATVEAVDYAKLLELHGWTCYLCGDGIEGREDLHFDHVIPLARGGAHSMDNVRPAHATCNLRKAYKLLSELPWVVAAA